MAKMPNFDDSPCCDKCGKVPDDYIGEGMSQSNYFHNISFTGGYGDYIISDLETYELSVCSNCILEFMFGFKKIKHFQFQSPNTSQQSYLVVDGSKYLDNFNELVLPSLLKSIVKLRTKYSNSPMYNFTGKGYVCNLIPNLNSIGVLLECKFDDPLDIPNFEPSNYQSNDHFELDKNHKLVIFTASMLEATPMLSTLKKLNQCRPIDIKKHLMLL